MLLSIGMIVKNEEKYLEQCLTALKPILDNVDSELIIADTGSIDNTVEIAKKFTDNVFHFEWINDFAAARNSTLDKAKGEWYMFIDADEVIKDCTPLIEFFNSGEYKDYRSATYVVRSYNDLTRMDYYTDYRALRMTMLEGGVRFIKPIHEIFSKGFIPSKNLDVIADHYGYVYMSDGKEIDGAAQKKSARNLDLLFRELEKGKANGTIDELLYGQISDCYFGTGDYEKALEYAELGMENCEPQSYVRIDYFNKILNSLMYLKRYDESIELCKFYFSKDNLPRTEKFVTDSNIYFIWAFASYCLIDYEETINKAVLGFDIYRSYLNGKLYTPELVCCSVETTIPMLKIVCNMFITACIALNKEDIASREMDVIPLKELADDREFMKIHLAMRIKVMENTNYNKLPDLYYQLDKPNREIFTNALIRNIFKTEKHEQFIKKLNLIAGDNERLADIIKIYTAYFDKRLIPSMTSEFIEKHGTADNETVWIMMMKRNFDPALFVCAEDFTAESIIPVFNDFSDASSAMDLFTTSLNKYSTENIDKLLTAFYEAVRLATERDLNTSMMVMCLGRFGKRWVELNSDKEKSGIISFALTIGEAAEFYRKKNFDECIKRLEELIGDVTDPDSVTDNTKIMQHYLKLVQADKKKATDMQKSSTDPETLALANQIKQTIRAMIDEWNLDNAEELLNKMANIAPFDPDIETLRDEITDRKVNYMKYM